MKEILGKLTASTKTQKPFNVHKLSVNSGKGRIYQLGTETG